MLRAIFSAIAFTSLIPLATFAKEVTIKPGETLSEIADRYDISITTLKQLNRIENPNQVQAGKRLSLPENRSNANNNRDQFHTVMNGETLSEIAMKYSLSQKDLIKVNDIKSANHLYLGQQLRLPKNKNKFIFEKDDFHIVSPGDTLEHIAKKYKKDKEELKKINNLKNSNYLFIGQNIKLSRNLSKNTNSSIEQKNPAKKEFFHVVTQGQNLSSIAKIYQIPVKDLIELNGLRDPNQLSAGMKLSLANNHRKKEENEILTLAVKPEKNEKRNYGPLQIDWSNWQLMNGSHVAPTIHKNGNSLYLAVNCSYRRLNATGANGEWKNWIAPTDNFEHDLINDLCN